MTGESRLIVLDTNVLVSALLKRKSKPGIILDLILTGELRLAFDQRILKEYRCVLMRPKFNLLQSDIDDILSFISLTGLIINLTRPLILSREWIDSGDIPFAEVAIAAKADALVTGNVRHYANLIDMGIFVLTPSEFLVDRQA